ncbi:L,D-transpeptidase family protein [Clostridium sp. HBUAS56010]|uniref:L,D-transpeptidase family protein n=1 Tax=Clostridium sp. HBUAS56010 TaxID=2571127 RepID=UPI0011773F35|nr:L,D-transpeptidase family protein [Clostridium sp. HBUAS56010]
MEKQKQRSRKKRSFGLQGWAVIGTGTVAAALIATFTYVQMGRAYNHVFFPNTTINGMNVSKKSPEEVKKMISTNIGDYKLTIQLRGGDREELKSSDIALESVFDGTLEQLVADQKPLSWVKHLKKPQSYELNTMIRYNEEKFEQTVSGFPFMKENAEDKAMDASVSDYRSGQGYHIIPAKEGKELDLNKAKTAISEAVKELKPELSLEEANAYISPQIPTDDPELVSRVQTMNQYVNTTITYKMGDEKKVLGGDIISKWIKTDENGKVYLDSGSVKSFVKELADRYDTAYKAKNLKTSYGKTVKITGGSYGWKINQSSEADELAQLIRSGSSQTREPVYKQKAASHGSTDYGNTYLEINLTAQHLYFYKDGKLIVDSDFVSGNESKGWSTPAGAYSLTYKERDATLKGENYRTPVSYWMPFNGNIGLHDAKWRSSFGGSIYKTGGSHGCVNLPPAVAKTIFENINAGIPVLCYHLPGTEAKTSTGGSGKPEETKAPDQTTSPTTTAPVTTQPAATTPAATAPAPTTAPQSTAPAVTPTSSAQAPAGPGVPQSSGKKEIGPGM